MSVHGGFHSPIAKKNTSTKNGAELYKVKPDTSKIAQGTRGCKRGRVRLKKQSSRQHTVQVRAKGGELMEGILVATDKPRDTFTGALGLCLKVSTSRLDRAEHVHARVHGIAEVNFGYPSLQTETRHSPFFFHGVPSHCSCGIPNLLPHSPSPSAPELLVVRVQADTGTVNIAVFLVSLQYKFDHILYHG